MSKELKHYFLVTGTVYFIKDNENYTPSFNALLVQESKNHTQQTIANAQYVLQKRLAEAIGDEEFQKATVIDVVINNLTFLGSYTGNEFYDVEK